MKTQNKNTLSFKKNKVASLTDDIMIDVLGGTMTGSIQLPRTFTCGGGEDACVTRR